MTIFELFLYSVSSLNSFSKFIIKFLFSLKSLIRRKTQAKTVINPLLKILKIFTTVFLNELLTQGC